MKLGGLVFELDGCVAKNVCVCRCCCDTPPACFDLYVPYGSRGVMRRNEIVVGLEVTSEVCVISEHRGRR
jgi:hypothetical protein